jgi:hypothetical protein
VARLRQPRGMRMRRASWAAECCYGPRGGSADTTCKSRTHAKQPSTFALERITNRFNRRSLYRKPQEIPISSPRLEALHSLPLHDPTNKPARPTTMLRHTTHTPRLGILRGTGRRPGCSGLDSSKLDPVYSQRSTDGATGHFILHREACEPRRHRHEGLRARGAALVPGRLPAVAVAVSRIVDSLSR